MRREKYLWDCSSFLLKAKAKKKSLDMFDENLKRGMKRQLDMHMRFWNDYEVNLQCLASFSVGQTANV